MAQKAKSLYSHDQRDISTPLCGTLKPQPETSKNVLLIKPQLGTVKSATWNLPSQTDFQHEYGLRQKRDGVTSGDVVGGWAQHDGTANQMPGRDFKALNAMAVVAGGCTSKDIADYRTTHDARLKLGTYKAAETMPYDSTTTFGRSTVASIPFGDLISHSYRYDWAQEQPPAETIKPKARKPGQTKTSLMAAEVSRAKLEQFENADVPKVLWKHAGFSKVPAKVGYTG